MLVHELTWHALPTNPLPTSPFTYTRLVWSGLATQRYLALFSSLVLFVMLFSSHIAGRSLLRPLPSSPLLSPPLSQRQASPPHPPAFLPDKTQIAGSAGHATVGGGSEVRGGSLRKRRRGGSYYMMQNLIGCSCAAGHSPVAGLLFPATIVWLLIAFKAKIKEATRPEVLADIKTGGCRGPGERTGGRESAFLPLSSQSDSSSIKLSNGLVIDVEKTGNGEEAQAGDKVRVQYSEYIESCDEKEANCKLLLNQKINSGVLDSELGAGQMLKGLEQGIAGMKVGEQRILHVPPALGFGINPPSPLPVNCGLKYKLQLVSVCSPHDSFLKSLMCSLGLS
eukprot:750701-Hanusia_phi.AAC.6